MLYAANDFLSEESRYVLFPQNGVPASNCVTTSAQIFFSGIPRLVSGWPKPFLANRAIDLPEICVPDLSGVTGSELLTALAEATDKTIQSLNDFIGKSSFSSGVHQVLVVEKLFMDWNGACEVDP